MRDNRHKLVGTWSDGEESLYGNLKWVRGNKGWAERKCLFSRLMKSQESKKQRLLFCSEGQVKCSCPIRVFIDLSVLFNKPHAKTLGHCVVGVHIVYHSEALTLSIWAMLLPLAPTLHVLGGTTDPEACPTTSHNSEGLGVLFTNRRGHLCLTRCSLAPSKWRKIFLMHVKFQPWVSSKTPTA